MRDGAGVSSSGAMPGGSGPRDVRFGSLGYFRRAMSVGVSALVMPCLAFIAGCGGGGGGNSPPPEAELLSFSNGVGYENGTLVLDAALNKPAVNRVTLTFTFAGTATGGASCATPGVDYVTPSALTFNAGVATRQLSITVCDDNRVEPAETVLVNWSSSSGARGQVVGTISGGLNDTGITLWSNQTGSHTLTTAQSAYPGQDADAGRDAAALTKTDADGRAGFAYDTAVATPCVRDKVTGLYWEAKTDDGGLHDKDNTYNATTWDALVNATNAANYCGFNDWRIPTAHELASLVDNSINPGANPTILASALSNQLVSEYWTSSLRSGDAGSSWVVSFATGGVALKNNTTNNYPIRLVRGGTHAVNAVASAACDQTSNADTPSARLTNNNDGTLTDTETGLMWKQCSEGQSGADCLTGAALTLGWQGALNRVTQVNSGQAGLAHGYSDWRLPNKNELASLVERRCANPAIDTTRFPNTQASSYWTASPYAGGVGFGWTVNFAEGDVGVGAMSGLRNLRLVRGGQ